MPILVCSNDVLRLTLTYLRLGQIFVTYALVKEKVKIMDIFRNYCSL